jgi:cysteinyl-tRNA synthetase
MRGFSRYFTRLHSTRSRVAIGALLAELMLGLAACTTTPSPQLLFVNITEGKILSGSVATPGVRVLNGATLDATLDLRSSSGPTGLRHTAATTPVCITGTCGLWDTTQLASGPYSLHASIKMADGSTLEGNLHFTIDNTTSPPAPPPPPAPQSPPPSPPEPPTPGKVAWADVKSWGIQYQKFNAASLEQLDNLAVDVLVLGRFDAIAEEWKSTDINQLKTKKWVFSYISAGQAQNIEWYWQPDWRPGNPSWLLEYTNIWVGTYNVRYSDPQWQSLVFQTIDRAINAGYDGAFFDQPDPYWAPGYPGGPSQENVIASKDLVCNIWNYVQSRKPGFKVFVNGGTNQIDQFRESYWNCLDATAGEHLWYLNTGVPEPPAYPAYAVPALQRLLPVGKKVFTFDFTADPAEIQYIVRTARSFGFIPTVTDPAISTTPVAY